jgi:hypothetical protein
MVAPDPYAEEITRFGGYRGVLRMRNGHRYRLPFGRQGELPAGSRLPDNNELVLYELPMRWVDSPWGGRPIVESGGVSQPLPRLTGSRVDLALHPFQIRVFAL